MPGIAGYIIENAPLPDNLLQSMSSALQEGDRFNVRQHQEPGVGLALLSLPRTEQQSGLVSSKDETRTLLLHGKLFNYDHLKRELENKGYQHSHHSDAEFLLHFLDAYGGRRLDELNGVFAAVSWDQKERELLLITDHLGLHPLYYREIPGGLLFGSGVRAILAHHSVEKNVDNVAIGQLLTFDHLLHQRTLVEGVTLLTQGSILRYHQGASNVRPYWQPLPHRTYELRSEKEWLDELDGHLNKVIRRQVSADEDAGILLSGGLDSRVILAYAERQQLTGIQHGFTFGIPGCDDQRSATEVAKAVHLDHHFFELKPDWLLKHATECVRLTDGMGNLVNQHAVATLDQASQVTPILYKGFLGDAMMGFAQRHQHWSAYSPDDEIKAHLQVHREQGVIIFEPDDHTALFTEAFRQSVGSGILDAYRCGMHRAQTSSLADQRIYFDYTQRAPRHTLNGVEIVRSRADVRLPFADKDLVEFALSIPPGLRYERRIMRDAFTREFPKLAQIPNPSTGLPFTECAREVSIRLQRLIRWHLNKRGLYKGDYHARRPYKDYNTWFRTVLRTWVEDNLLSKTALERGYFNAPYITRLVNEHMTGTVNHSVRIGALLAIELWHQQFID